MIEAEACPSSDSHYALVMGQCLYFEETTMNYTEAKTNCANKMTSYGLGRLFEPKSYNMSEMVAAKAKDILARYYFRIGVNDIVQPDNYVYESNSIPIGFTPNWVPISSYQPGNNNNEYKCILVGCNQKGNVGMWADHKCDVNVYSVCE